MRSAAVIGACGALGIAACTLIYGPSDADFTGGKPDGGKLADGAAASSSSSSGGAEGGTPRTDGGGSDGGGTPFTCPARALLCDDFEDPQVNPFPASAGDIQLVDGGEGGSAHALSATLKAGQSSPNVSASFDPTTAAATYDFWFRIDSPPPDAETHFRLADVLWGAACDWQAAWTAYVLGSSLVVDLTSYDHAKNASCGPIAATAQNPAVATVALGVWHHLSVVTDARTSHVTAVTTIDALAPFTLALDLARSDTPTTVSLELGVPCTQTGGGCFDWTGGDWRVLYDDVSFTLPSP